MKLGSIYKHSSFLIVLPPYYFLQLHIMNFQSHDIFQSTDVHVCGRKYYSFDSKFFTNTCIMLCVFYQLKNIIGNYGH